MLVAAPTPVSTPQPISAATLKGTDLSTFTMLISGTIASSPNVPSMAIWWSGAPADVSRVVPSSSPPITDMADFSHNQP